MKTIKPAMPGLFDYENRMEKLCKSRNDLDRLDVRIDWEMFRGDLGAIVQKACKAS